MTVAVRYRNRHCRDRTRKQLAHPVCAEIGHDHSIAVAHALIAGNNSRQDELITTPVLPRIGHSSRSIAGGMVTLGTGDEAPGTFCSVPAVISVHGEIAAADSRQKSPFGQGCLKGRQCFLASIGSVSRPSVKAWIAVGMPRPVSVLASARICSSRLCTPPDEISPIRWATPPLSSRRAAKAPSSGKRLIDPSVQAVSIRVRSCGMTRPAPMVICRLRNCRPDLQAGQPQVRKLQERISELYCPDGQSQASVPAAQHCCGCLRDGPSHP